MRQLIIDNYKSNMVEGTIHVDEDGMMMTSIINEPGWKVYIDGKEQKVKEIGDCFVSVPLTAGDHDIKIHFVPESLPLAALLSTVSIVIFVAYVMYYRKKHDEGENEKEQVVTAGGTGEA